MNFSMIVQLVNILGDTQSIKQIFKCLPYNSYAILLP